MIEEPKKLQIKKPDSSRQASDEQLRGFQGVSTGFVVDALGGYGALSKDIAPFAGTVGNAPVVGRVLTVQNSPGDILATLAALAFISPGDIVVAVNSGYQGCASCGDRLLGMMKNSGAIACVSDGPVRDSLGVTEIGLPLWCTGITPNSPFSTGPGSVGLPVNLGGCGVNTGDIIVADLDGVVVVPLADVDRTLARLSRVAELEAELDQQVRDGLKIPPAIEALLDSDEVAFL